MKMPRLRAGDGVRIRSREEILATLDQNGELDGMPFMPEMFAFCGQEFQVYKRAHKTCDTVFPVRGRRVDRSVHLVTRCDGSAHGGCQAGCLLFWKESWLERVGQRSDKNADAVTASSTADNVAATRCTESRVWARAKTEPLNGETPTYTCQATRLPYATSPLEWWDIRQYIEDYESGNVGLWRMLEGLVYSAYYSISRAGIGAGRAMRWFYDTFHRFWGGTTFPRSTGVIPASQPTPMVALNLQPGELVRIKSHREILKTLNTRNANRGLYFDAEMVPYCGRTYRVLKRVNKIIDERTGMMQEMKTPSIVLESVICESRYSECRMFCPRSIYSYWREIWLERVSTT